MNIWYRRIVYVLFIVIFLIVAPIVILYTQGYRYNFERGTVQKTGIMIVSSIPRKADIYLNNIRYTQRQTPAKIERLLPGDYEIRLEKEGYHAWQKRLPVFENGSTFAEKIILWKKSTATSITSSPQLIDWQQQTDRGEIAILDAGGNLIIMNPERGQISATTPVRTTSKQNLEWSASQKKLLNKNTDESDAQCEIILFEIFKNPTIQKISPDYKNCFWDHSNDAILYGAKKDNSIWRFDTFTKTEQRIGRATSTKALLVKNNVLYSHDGNALYSQNIATGATEKITNIICSNCQLAQKNGQYIILQDAHKEQIHFINESAQQRITSVSAKDIDWLNGNVLLFYNNWELWIYDLNKDQPELITRFGTPLTSALWHPEGRHIFLATNNEIKVVELDNRELRNIITLATTTNQRYLAIDRKGEYLYYDSTSTSEPSSSAIHQLILQ